MPFSSRVLSWLVQEQGSVRGKSEWLASKDSVYVYRMIKPPPLSDCSRECSDAAPELSVIKLGYHDDLGLRSQRCGLQALDNSWHHLCTCLMALALLLAVEDLQI